MANKTKTCQAAGIVFRNVVKNGRLQRLLWFARPGPVLGIAGSIWKTNGKTPTQQK